MANISIAGHKHREKRNEPVVVVVAFREPVQPDDVAVVEPPQQLHLPVEVPLPRPSSPALARRTVATRPPAKRALYAAPPATTAVNPLVAASTSLNPNLLTNGRVAVPEKNGTQFLRKKG